MRKLFMLMSNYHTVENKDGNYLDMRHMEAESQELAETAYKNMMLSENKIPHSHQSEKGYTISEIKLYNANDYL